ncbi:MAG: DUF924 family protein [Parvibaculum sp.]
MEGSPSEIVRFWREAGPALWFKKDLAFDDEIRFRFLSTVEAAFAGRLSAWESSDEGLLALVLLFDQFTRNIWRDDARAFSGDLRALALSRLAIERGVDLRMGEAERCWFYMPFMHSEDLAAQQAGMEYFATRLDDPGTLKFAQIHLDIIERFGRFPHRNVLLGRETGVEEQAFLDEGGFKG